MSSDKTKTPEELERAAFFEKTEIMKKRLEKSLKDCQKITEDTKHYIEKPNVDTREKMQSTPRFRRKR